MLTSVLYRTILQTTVACTLIWQVSTKECVIGKHDFSLLNGLPWLIRAQNGSAHFDYEISLCQPLSQPCPQDSAVCRYSNNRTQAVSFGKVSDQQISLDANTGGLVLLLKGGATCPGDTNRALETSINFICDQVLGSPILVDTNDCTLFFEWRTSAACAQPSSIHSEVRCYIYDDDGKKHDLSPLIKQHGGYMVQEDFYVNVCREITADTETGTCSSAACKQRTDVGHPQDGLQRGADGNLWLRYVTSATPPAGCSQSASTKITFVCPNRGEGRDPVLTSSLDCQYEVEWQTEYACAEDYLVTKTCQFSADRHGVLIDLTPLSHKADGGQHYVDAVSSNGKKYRYYMSICDPLTTPCPQKLVPGLAVCQVDMNIDSYGVSLGKFSKHLLRYSDRELTMIYEDDQTCDKHFRRKTIITFHCNETVDVGTPTYRSDDNCTYMFDWDTKHACVPKWKKCRVDVGKKRFDLSTLVRHTTDVNWEALTDVTTSTSKSRYFINVCDGVIKLADAKDCPAGAAICQSTGSTYRNLGKFTSSPTYSAATSDVILHYKDGDSCGEGAKRIESIVTLKCKPGDLQSGPALQHQSDDGCRFEFEWQTAAACVLSQQKGAGCKVVDDEAGYSFDLSALTRHGENAYYLVHDNATAHHYYINVCAKVTGTNCSSKSTEAAICQLDSNDVRNVFNTGQPNEELTYYDGVITLTYTGGDLYHSNFSRRSEIAFVCNRSAGVGQPRYQTEFNHTYSFLWPTRFACPDPPVQCAVTDAATGVQYDISSLSQPAEKDNWFAMDDKGSGGEKKKFYLNVCRPLNPVNVGNGCSSLAGICVTEFGSGKEQVLVENLGEALQSPTIEANGSLLLTFTNGSSCKETDGKLTTYTSTVNLHCQRGALLAGPEFVQKVGNCQYSFIWNTEAACSSEHSTTSDADEPCSVKDANSQYVYSMRSLIRKGDIDFYEVHNDSTSRKFKLNICGIVSDCGGSVCEGENIIAKVSTKLSVTSEGVLSLAYKPGQRQDDDGILPRAILTFECDRSVDVADTRVVFERRDAGATYLFTVVTALACPPMQLDCAVTDSDGFEYDLAPLGQTVDNWVTADTRPEHADLRYYINVCRPVNPIPGVTVLGGGAVGAYQVSDSGDVHVSGYILSKLHVFSNGTVTLRYMNGERCHKNKPHDSHRSTLIIFSCDDVEHGPVFQDELSECEYLFVWRTPVVCRVKKVTGDKCSVVEPLYGTTFDLSSLRKTGSADWQVTSGTDKFLLNVCGALNSGSGSCSGAGSCQQTGDTSLNIGDANSRLSYRDGQLSLLYTHGTGSCLGAYEKATRIDFLCDHQNDVGGGGGAAAPRHVSTAASACEHLFQWPTSLACPLIKHVDCRVDDDAGNHYDLTSLTLTSDNYEVVDGVNEGKKFVINVCAPLVHKKGVTCSPNSAACLIDENQKDPAKRFVSIGRIGEHVLSVEKNHLRLEYSSGAICASESGNDTWKTVVTLSCSHDAIDTQPTYLSTSSCQVNLIWVTAAACTVVPVAPSGDCTAKNPQTGYTFNLNSLKKAAGYKMADGSERSLVINICAPIENSPCGSKSGSCIVDKSDGGNAAQTAGEFNSRLTFVEGLLTLRYHSDQSCAGVAGNATRSTVVNFVCNPDQSGDEASGPSLVGDTDHCTYYVNWQTALACEQQVKCSVELSGEVLDLSPLIKQTGFHTALDMTGTDKSTTYYVSVCRPLSPIRGTFCPPQAAVCKLTEGKDPQSLGRVVHEPFVDKSTGKVTIVYEHGVKCRDTYMTSKIVFICQRGPSLGVPNLVFSEGNCTYIFEWKTNVVCSESPAVTKTDCRFTDASTGHVFDFKPLSKSDGYDKAYQVTTGMGELSLSVCGVVADCPHASSCLQGTDGKKSSYGTAGSETFIREGGRIKMSYAGGDLCPTGSAASTYILFICDDSVVGTGQPTLFMDITSCEVVLQWRTPFACVPSLPDCDIAHAGHIFDLSPLTRASGSYSFQDANDKYWLNVCAGVQMEGCPVTAIACRQRHDGSKDVLALVSTQKMNVLDDGETIVAEYSEGSAACGQRRRRSDNPTASVRIIFKCGSTVGTPVLVHRNENRDKCLFEFQWVTKVACAENRVAVHSEKGVFTDPLTGTHLDITSLLNAGNVKTADGAYIVNLQGVNDISGCPSSAICQMTGANYQSIADIKSKQFYMEDGVVQVMFTGGATCRKDDDSADTMSTKLNIRCANTTDGRPSLVYKSSDGCQLLFEWPSVDVCIDGVGSKTSLSRQHPHHTGLIVSIVTICLLICILAFMLRKPATRKALANRLRTLRSVAANGSVRYSKLFSSDENAGAQSAGYTLLGSNTASSSCTYTSFDDDNTNFLNDDSDEDMLL